jgi:hypothetical protein
MLRPRSRSAMYEDDHGDDNDDNHGILPIIMVSSPLTGDAGPVLLLGELVVRRRDLGLRQRAGQHGDGPARARKRSEVPESVTRSRTAVVWHERGRTPQFANPATWHEWGFDLSYAFPLSLTPSPIFRPWRVVYLCKIVRSLRVPQPSVSKVDCLLLPPLIDCLT